MALLQAQLRASEEEQERAEATLERTLDDFDEERDGILVQVSCLNHKSEYRGYLSSTCWYARALFCFKVDGFVPETQRVNLSMVCIPKVSEVREGFAEENEEVETRLGEANAHNTAVDLENHRLAKEAEGARVALSVAEALADAAMEALDEVETMLLSAHASAREKVSVAAGLTDKVRV